MSIGPNLRAARSRRRLTQHDIAAGMRAAGYRWHGQTVGLVERGERRLYVDELVALAAVLDCPAWALCPPLAPGVVASPDGRDTVWFSPGKEGGT